MELEPLLDRIERSHEDNADICFLVKVMHRDLSVRKQLADMIHTEPPRLDLTDILEVSKWGLADWTSLHPEIRKGSGRF